MRCMDRTRTLVERDTMNGMPARTKSATVELPHDRFLDRELSWLAWNERVLELAEDADVPLLERARYLAIFADNLDEFFMVRVAGLKRRMATGIAVRAASGLSPRELLEAIWARSSELMARAALCLHNEVIPHLAKNSIDILQWTDLSDDELALSREEFRKNIYPILTPLAVDPAHPFPYISGLSLNLAVMVRNPHNGEELFARVKVPPLLPRFFPVAAQRFVALEDIIAAHLDELFPGMEIVQHHTFRVTRNEDLEVEEDDAENLLKALEAELMRRRFGPPVRLEVENSIDPDILDLLVRELGISTGEVFAMPGPLDLTGLFGFADLDRAELRFAPFLPRTHPDLTPVESASPVDVLAAMRAKDILLHHPYDAFSTSVQRFLEQAAADPDVLAIKQTLYRTSGDSPIVDALIAAAEEGKQVLALVEIKARFDEEANISWARKLEQAGVHVVYGLVGLKTHCKLSMVIRHDQDGLRRYTHIGTGNYHPKTARLYEDLGLLTTDRVVGEDVSRLFNQLSGYSVGTSFERLLVAPESIRTGLLERIEREIEHAEAGKRCGIRFKTNALVDEQIIDGLYRASMAGVPIDLVTRSICALKPGVPGLSETIRVRSVLGRFLEHSRIYYFDNGGDTDVLIGSADMMHRNLDRRVETLVKVTTPAHRQQLQRLLDRIFDKKTASWYLDSSGTWTRHHLSEDGKRLKDLQDTLIAQRRNVGRRSTRALAQWA